MYIYTTHTLIIFLLIMLGLIGYLIWFTRREAKEISKGKYLITVNTEKLDHYPANINLPNYATSNSAGLDLIAAISESIELKPRDLILIPTGLKLEIPKGFEGQIRPRSGLSLKNGITVLNSPGTIDADYRGELCVILINLGKKPFKIETGMRIAQLVISPISQVTLNLVSKVTETKRNNKGFGSTGLLSKPRKNKHIKSN